MRTSIVSWKNIYNLHLIHWSIIVRKRYKRRGGIRVWALIGEHYVIKTSAVPTDSPFSKMLLKVYMCVCELTVSVKLNHTHFPPRILNTRMVIPFNFSLNLIVQFLTCTSTGYWQCLYEKVYSDITQAWCNKLNFE